MDILVSHLSQIRSFLTMISLGQSRNFQSRSPVHVLKRNTTHLLVGFFHFHDCNPKLQPYGRSVDILLRLTSLVHETHVLAPAGIERVSSETHHSSVTGRDVAIHYIRRK